MQTWCSPDTARTNGRLYHLLFAEEELNAKEESEKVYFKNAEGEWYSICPASRVVAEPIAILPV